MPTQISDCFSLSGFGWILFVRHFRVRAPETRGLLHELREEEKVPRVSQAVKGGAEKKRGKQEAQAE